MNKEPRACTICGEFFTPQRYNQICCGYVCRHKRARMVQREYQKNYKSEIHEQTPVEDHKRIPATKKLTITQIASLALAEHLTYGQYVAKYNI